MKPEIFKFLTFVLFSLLHSQFPQFSHKKFSLTNFSVRFHNSHSLGMLLNMAYSKNI